MRQALAPKRPWFPGDMYRRGLNCNPWLHPTIDGSFTMGDILRTDCVLVLACVPVSFPHHMYAYVISMGEPIQVGWTLMLDFEKVK